MWLEHSFEEVEFVVRGCKGYKALGSYGFSFAFFQHCWVVVWYDIMGVCVEFQEHCRFERSHNVTFMVLIP